MENFMPAIYNRKARRVWFITDTHLGIRNNSGEWIDIISNYFYEWFLPLVRENYQPGDIIIHAGDYYDSRQSINVKVLNLGVEIAEELSKIFVDGVYIIVGNHDVFGKNSNDVNSLKSIKWISSINVIEEPVSITLGDKTFFMMPWRKDQEAEAECLENATPHDYLCCHCDIRGLKFNRYSNVEHGSSIDKFRKFGRVYSGHIHYAQESENIKMLGSPYELTRSDMGNPKGITLLDLSTGKETYFSNNFSPKHKRVEFTNLLNLSPDEASSIFNNNFVDVMIDPKMAMKAPLNIISEMLPEARRISFHPYDQNQINNLSENIQVSENRQFNVMDFIKEYVNSLETTEETKTKMINSINKLHSIIISQEQEGKI
jgi:DNA repair exonuclease SbcCD nuclease subunit